jgi:hypothetical protein
MSDRGALREIIIRRAYSLHQHQQSHGKAPKRRLRFPPTPKCSVRLQRGWQQQPAHNNKHRGALNAAAAECDAQQRTSKPASVSCSTRQTHRTRKHWHDKSSQGSARSPLQPHLHFHHTTPRHTLHHHLSPAAQHTALRDMMCVSEGAVASRWHANATQGSMEAHSPTQRSFRDNAIEVQQCLLPTVMRKNHFWNARNWSARVIGSRSSSDDSSLPRSGSMTINTRLRVMRLWNYAR